MKNYKGTQKKRRKKLQTQTFSMITVETRAFLQTFEEHKDIA